MMNRNSMTAIFIATLLGASLFAGAQSLADQARAAQRNKPAAKATKVYDNDSIGAVASAPVNQASSSAGASTAPTESATAEAGDKGAADAAADDKKSDSKKDTPASLKKEIEAQQQEIDRLKRESDITEREWKLKQAAYYGDAGNQLRDPKKWADAQRAYQDESNTKRDALTKAQQKLDELQEKLRKSGA